MAQTGFTPILIYGSGTATNVPSASNLTNSANGAELAINYADGKLFYKDGSGNVQTIASKAAASGSFGAITATSITNSGLTAGRVVYTTTGGLETASANLTFDGTSFSVGGTTDPFGRGYGRMLGLTSASSAGIEINAATGNNAVIDMGVNGTRSLSFTTDGTTPYLNTIGALPLGFATNGIERARIDSSGNVGIGTSSPSYKLDLSGTSGIIARFTGTTSSTGVSIYSSATSYVGDLTATNTVGFNASSNYVSFGTNATEKMRLDSSGNLGLGVTPATSSRVTFQVGSLLTIDNGANISNNAVFNSGWKYITTAASAQYYVGAGAHYWYNAPSGTAGNLIAFTQAMTLDNSGNLVVGATSALAKMNSVSAGAALGGTAQLAIGSSTNDYENTYFRIDNSGNSNFCIDQKLSGVSYNRFFIERTTGNVGIGTSTTNISGGGNGTYLTILGKGSTAFAASGRIELANPNTPANNNGCGELLFVQVGNTSETRIASILGTTSGSGGANGFGGYLIFATKTDNGSGPLERMRIDSSGNVGIGTTSPSASAILDAQSTTKGVRMPNMTTTQKNAIASPAAGLMVFDTTLSKLCVYTGSAWQTITSI